MSDERQAMRERLNAFALTGAAHKVYIEKIGWGLTADGVLAFAESEVRAALAPREQSPELAEAEEWLRDWPSNHTSWSQRNRLCMIIAAELDRLRAEVARLSQPAPEQPTDTVDVTYYAAGESAKALHSKLTDPDDSVCMRDDPEDAADDGDEDERVYSVRTIITRHDGSAPAQDRATRVVYAVAFGNYGPDEIDSVWGTKEEADTRCAELGDDWRVRTIEVQSRITAERAKETKTP